jgi:hypothetical protein
MIARHRGDERIHSRWRAGAGAISQAPAPSTRAEPMLGEREVAELEVVDWPQARRRRSWALIAVVVVAPAR